MSSASVLKATAEERNIHTSGEVVVQRDLLEA